MNFECEVCHKQFITSYKVKTHKEKTHKKTFECEKCYRRYTWRNSLKQHHRKALFLRRLKQTLIKDYYVEQSCK